MQSKKSFEINPKHRIITSIKERCLGEDEDKSIGSLVELLFETSLLASGFTLENPENFSRKLNSIIESGLGLHMDEAEGTETVDTEIAENTADNTEEVMEQVD